jgi:pseudouridine synthase
MQIKQPQPQPQPILDDTAETTRPVTATATSEEDDDDDDDDQTTRQISGRATSSRGWTSIAGPSVKIPMNATLRILLLPTASSKQDKNNMNHAQQSDHRNNVHDTAATAAATATTTSSARKVEVVPPMAPLLAVYYKPKWVLSVRSDPHLQRPCLDAATLPAHSPLLPDTASSSGSGGSSSSSSSSSNSMMHPAGRLDYDSSGLLLFSSSGALTQRILHPHFDLQKEYRVTVVGNVLARATGGVDDDDDDENENENKQQSKTISLREQLALGVKTGEGVHVATLREDSIVVQQDVQVVTRYLHDLRQNLPPEYNITRLQEHGYLNDLDPTRTTCISTFSLIVTEGKHRMIRRMLANCGFPVLDLHRVRIGQIHLNATAASNDRNMMNSEHEGDDHEETVLLKPGEYRYLTLAEESWVQNKLLSSGKSATTSSKTKKLPPSRRKALDKKETTTSSSPRFDNAAAGKNREKMVNIKKSRFD